MKIKPVVLRELAHQDIDDVLAYYLSEGTPTTALDSIDRLEQGFAHIGCHPCSGSPRHAHELDLPGLRFWSLKRHPYLIFYVEHDSYIDVWRVLHSSRDIPRWMQESDRT